MTACDDQFSGFISLPRQEKALIVRELAGIMGSTGKHPRHLKRLLETDHEKKLRELMKRHQNRFGEVDYDALNADGAFKEAREERHQNEEIVESLKDATSERDALSLDLTMELVQAILEIQDAEGVPESARFPPALLEEVSEILSGDPEEELLTVLEQGGPQSFSELYRALKRKDGNFWTKRWLRRTLRDLMGKELIRRISQHERAAYIREDLQGHEIRARMKVAPLKTQRLERAAKNLVKWVGGEGLPDRVVETLKTLLKEWMPTFFQFDFTGKLIETTFYPLVEFRLKERIREKLRGDRSGLREDVVLHETVRSKRLRLYRGKSFKVISWIMDHPSWGPAARKAEIMRMPPTILRVDYLLSGFGMPQVVREWILGRFKDLIRARVPVENKSLEAMIAALNFLFLERVGKELVKTHVAAYFCTQDVSMRKYIKEFRGKFEAALEESIGSLSPDEEATLDDFFRAMTKAS